jgi:hypothetical protein
VSNYNVVKKWVIEGKSESEGERCVRRVKKIVGKERDWESVRE